MSKAEIEKINKYLFDIRNNNFQSIELLYDLIAPTIRYIALKYLKNVADADDLVQDFWADIIKISNRFVFQKNGYSYVCKCMNRKAINRYKKLHSGKSVCIEFVDYSLCNLIDESMMNNIDNLIMVQEAFKFLSETEKIVIQETYFEDKTVRAIAKDLHLSKSNVARIKSEAINKMKNFFNNWDKADI